MTTLTTKALYHAAYRAARLALSTDAAGGRYESPLGAAMRSTYGAETLWRYKLTTHAANAAQMTRSYRVRRSTQRGPSLRLMGKLLNYRASRMEVK